jgi:uncharacterized protein with HEPN domain
VTREPSDDPGGRYPAESFGERDWQALEDLSMFGSLAEDLVSRGKAAYDADVHLQLSGEMIQTKIGEAVSRLSDALIEASPQIRFRAMKRARNLISHNYQIVDPEIVWNTLSVELPKDITKIREMLAQRC